MNHHPVIIPVSSVRGKTYRGTDTHTLPLFLYPLSRGDGDTRQMPSDTCRLPRASPPPLRTSNGGRQVLPSIVRLGPGAGGTLHASPIQTHFPQVLWPISVTCIFFPPFPRLRLAVHWVFSFLILCHRSLSKGHLRIHSFKHSDKHPDAPAGRRLAPLNILATVAGVRVGFPSY